ncbi:MAG: GGDEF domain-containing protein, partial [Thiohalomonadales bacterium]
TIDPLSKLNNLRYFLRRTTQELAMAERHHASLSLLGIRIDNPERIRDSHGDKTLEKIILWTVNSLSPLLRKEDILTHTNKCEFIVIAPATNRMSAAIFGERVRKNLLQKKYLETTLTIPVSVSMGLINNISDEMGDAEISLQLLRNRLQKAQDLGGNRICASDKVARTPAIRKKVQIDKQEALRSALLSLTSDISSDNYIDIAKIAKKLLPLLDQVNQGLHLDLAEYVVAFRQKIAKHID